jgi:protein-tyrosine phosphatase
VTSGPAVSYPSLAYRNPLPKLVSFLTSRHEEEWCIFEFRAEGTGYSDKDVGGRVQHFPWPDHHPPPFVVMPELIESMRVWLDGHSESDIENKNGAASEKVDEKKKKVAILHCKAGKGRSGTVACSFLISIRGWEVNDALKRFTERRMRPGWGEGISIKSQRRWINYVDRWSKGGKSYQDGKLKIIELQIWGRRENVTIMIRGFVKEGKKIKILHKWKSSEGETKEISAEEMKNEISTTAETEGSEQRRPSVAPPSQSTRIDSNPSHNNSELPADTITTLPSGKVPALISNDNGNAPPATFTVLRPTEPLIVGTLDANIEVERRNRTSYGLPSVVTSTAHSWFNAFFEGNGPEQNGIPQTTGTYTIEWDAMDGLKGSSRRGVRAVEKVCVVWEILDPEEAAKEEKIAEESRKHKHDSDSDEPVRSDTDSKTNIVEGETGGESEAEEAVQSFVEPQPGAKK